MKKFEVGHKYGAVDAGLGWIEVLKRTAHFITVRNQYGNEWRMKIRECEGKNGSHFECAVDHSVGRKWMEAFTYMATLEE